MTRRNLRADDLVDIATDGVDRRNGGFKVVLYRLPDGCCGAYYPEANPLAAHGPQSCTPSYKAIPVRLRASTFGAL